MLEKACLEPAREASHAREGLPVSSHAREGLPVSSHISLLVSVMLGSVSLSPQLRVTSTGL